MSGLEILASCLALALAVSIAIIVVYRLRIMGLEDRYHEEREQRIREMNRHPFCGGVIADEPEPGSQLCVLSLFESKIARHNEDVRRSDEKIMQDIFDAMRRKEESRGDNND